MFERGITTLKQGRILGERLEDGIMAFKGIPYAKPPIGALRWKLAEAPLPWEGVLDCRDYRPSFTQVTLQEGSFYQKEFYPFNRPMSEDGLSLNVWTPAKAEEEKLPIYIWIHGGGFVEGSGAALQFIGNRLAQKGLVVVTINYRLGALGFMGHPELTAEAGASGNYAFSDMIQAIRFVKENAKGFGGDPENITIDGQSAGSMAVLSLVASAKAKGLFQKAMAQSGGVLGREVKTLKDLEAQGIELQKALGAKSIAEMRLIPDQEILAVSKKLGLVFRPGIDGLLLDRPHFEIYEAGLQNPVDLIVGSNAAEGAMAQAQAGDLEAHQKAAKAYGAEEAEFLRLFPAKSDEEACRAGDLFRSAKTFAGMEQIAALQKKLGKKAFLYCFEQESPNEDGSVIGAFHSSELVFQFGTLYTSTFRPWREEDHALSGKHMAYIAAFCKSGSPNAEGLPLWEEYDGEHCMRIGPKLGMSEKPFGEALSFAKSHP
ncbi:MAG: carboxylesterase family protein [Christensenellaceae bacterium]|jgi:para-nitrobenzyl esterase|nr:carboxylesterase family protein [Christensenellaceae bacterium]